MSNFQVAKKSAEQIWNDVIDRSISFFESASPSFKSALIEDWVKIIKANIDNRISDLEKQNADLKNDDRIHLNRIQELKEKISDLEKQIDNLKSELKEAETEIDLMGDLE